MILIASKNIKGITVEIGGDVQGLNKALDSVDKKSQDLGAELKQVNRLLKLDPDNVVLLAQKQKILSEQVETSKEKLEKLKSVQDQIERQYKTGQIDDGAYRAFQREVIDAENALERANAQINNTAKNMGKVEGKTSSFGSKIKSAGRTAVTAFKAAAAAAVAVGGAFGAAAISAASFADDILTTSTNTGLSVEFLQAYAYAAELVDVDLETMTKSMSKNIKAMSNAQKGTKDYVNAYKELGVKVTDSSGALRDSETVYWEVIDALGAIDDETKRDSISMQIFGKSAQELNSLIAVGSQGLKTYADEAGKMGAVLDSKTLSQLGALDDSFQRLKASATIWKNQLGAAIAPELNAFLEKIISFTSKNLSKVINGVKSVFTYIKSFSPQLKSIFSSAKKIFSTVINIVKDVFKDIKPLINSVLNLVDSIAKSVSPALKKIHAVLKPIIKIVASILKFVVDIVNWVTKLTNNIFGISGKVNKELQRIADAANAISSEAQEASESWESLTDQMSESIAEADGSASKLAYLKEELSNIVDENGNLIGSEYRLNSILKQLSSEGFQVQYDANNKQIAGYQKLQEEIQKTITMRQYEARMTSIQTSMDEAYANQAIYAEKRAEAAAGFEEVNAKMINAMNEWNEGLGGAVYGTADNIEEFINLLKKQDYDDFFPDIDAAIQSWKDYGSAYEEYTQLLNESSAAIEYGSEALAAGTAGNYEEAIGIVTEFYSLYSDTVDNGSTKASQSLDELNTTLKNEVSQFEKDIAAGNLNYADIQLDNISTTVKRIEEEGGKIPEAYATAINNGISKLEEAGYSIPQGLANGIDANTGLINESGVKMGDAAKDGFTESTEINSPSKVFMRYGENLVDGLILGMQNRREKVRQIAASIARLAANAMKSVLKINSPSKLTREYGQFFSEGLERGMLDRIRDVQNVSARLAASAAMPIADTSTSSFNVYNTNNFNTTAARDGAALVRQINRDLGTMYYKR